MNRLITFLALTVIIAGLVCNQVFATTALYNQTVRVVDSSGNIINSFGSGGAALSGVVTGAANANIFNTTNAAGNTMTNAFTVNNTGSNNSGYDLVVWDASGSSTLLFPGNSAADRTIAGTVGSFVDNPAPSATGIALFFNANDSGGGPSLECDSASYSAGGVPNSCYVQSPNAFGADKITNAAGTGAPNFSNGLTEGNVVVGSLPTCVAGLLGVRRVVTDYAVCTFNVAVVGGSAGHTCPVFCGTHDNGSTYVWYAG